MPKLHDLCQLFLEDLETLAGGEMMEAGAYLPAILRHIRGEGPWILDGEILAREVLAVSRGRGYRSGETVSGREGGSLPPRIEELVRDYFAPQEAPSMDRKS